MRVFVASLPSLPHRSALLGVVVTTLLGLAACSESTSGSSTPTPPTTDGGNGAGTDGGGTPPSTMDGGPSTADGSTKDGGAPDGSGSDGGAPDGSSAGGGDGGLDGSSSTDGGAASDGATDGSTDGGASSLEVKGTWSSDFGGYEEIDATNWNDTKVVLLEGASRTVYVQNPASDPYFPNNFSKIQWTPLQGDAFYYCTVDYGRATLADAQASTKTADPSSPDTAGCGSYPWTKLTRVAPLEIVGTWKSNFGETEVISSRKWQDTTVVKFDNTTNVAFTQNPNTAPYYPNKFSKRVWTEVSGGAFYYCTVDFNLDSLAAAEATTKTADPTNPETGGCGTFPWTKLSPP